MPEETKSSRPWMDIAAEASKETDSQKLSKLIKELNEALDDEQRKKAPKSQGNAA
jgi:hypothetical protein